MCYTLGMTLAELETFVNAIRANGGTDETEVRVLNEKTWAVIPINVGRVYNVSGFPVLVINGKR